MEILVCRTCDRRFNVLQLREGKRCPYCLSKNIGTFDSLLDADKKQTKIQAMKEQLKKMDEMLKEDDASLESLELQGKHKYGCEFYTPDPHEVVNEVWQPISFNPEDYDPENEFNISKSSFSTKWNLQLSSDDIDSQRFTTCTIDAEDVKPGEITTETIDKMQEIFIDTFKELPLSDDENI